MVKEQRGAEKRETEGGQERKKKITIEREGKRCRVGDAH